MWCRRAAQHPLPLVRWLRECPCLPLFASERLTSPFLSPPQMTTQYCSPECQKTNWASHKSICQHTSSAKQSVIGSGSVDENLVKNLRKFTSMHANLLGWAGFQALQLKRMPANIRQHALLVELSYQPNTDSLRRLVLDCLFNREFCLTTVTQIYHQVYTHRISVICD